MAQESSHRHRVALIVGEGSNPFEMTVAIELFGISRPELGGRLYDFTACAPTRSVRMREGLFTMSVPGTMADVAAADTVIVPNRPDPEVPAHHQVLDAVRAAHRRGARLVSFCTGAFTLAAAGVLDGHTVTTHWKWSRQFREMYPDVSLRPDVLFVDDGRVLSAAGSAAALDLCLYIVRADHGAAVASVVSRRLVFALHRDGGQQQFIERPVPPAREPGLSGVTAWASANLHRPITVAELAARAAMSPSTFHRRFLAGTGDTPLRWLHRQRVDRARELLETTDLDVDAIARRAGLGTAANLREHFRRQTGLSPSAYRNRHSRQPASRAQLAVSAHTDRSSM
jgi:AraC family transcriptional regulator, transcriptional activator FtrA